MQQGRQVWVVLAAVCSSALGLVVEGHTRTVRYSAVQYGADAVHLEGRCTWAT